MLNKVVDLEPDAVWHASVLPHATLGLAQDGAHGFELPHTLYSAAFSKTRRIRPLSH